MVIPNDAQNSRSLAGCGDRDARGSVDLPGLDLAVVPVRDYNDIPSTYRGTPVADLLAFHNVGRPHPRYLQAELLVGMCMDHRKQLRIPENFAYVMRAAGANLRGLEFQISFAIAVGGARSIAIICHDQCGMSGLAARRDAFVSGLVDVAGWEHHVAVQHFDEHEQRLEIGDPIEFAHAQACHLRQQFPNLTVAPLLYRLDDGMLYIIEPEEGYKT